MANPQIPISEQNLTPQEVEQLDHRRQMGLVFQVISGQCAIIATLLTWWIGQDLVYARPHGHLIAYYFVLTSISAITFGIIGTRMRRGMPSLD